MFVPEVVHGGTLRGIDVDLTSELFVLVLRASSIAEEASSARARPASREEFMKRKKFL